MSGDFDLRGGTANELGIEYEHKMMLYLAVAACNQEDLKDFWLVNNVAGVGALDDIILYTETFNGKKNLQFIQLKHKENPNRRKFSADGIQLPKYLKGIEDIQSLLKQQNLDPKKNSYLKTKKLLEKTGVSFKNMEFIYMTTAVINRKEKNVLCMPKKTFINTNPKNVVYQVTPNMTDNYVYKQFLSQFFMYESQTGVFALTLNIMTELNKYIGSDFTNINEAAEILQIAVKQDFISNGRKLTLALCRVIISTSILSTFFKKKRSTTTYPALSKKDWSIFQKLVKSFQLIILFEDTSKIDNFYRFKNSLNFTTCKESCIKLVIKCLRQAENEKVLWLNSNSISVVVEGDISILQSLKDLQKESRALLFDYSLKIQGREKKFESLLKRYPDIENIFNVDDILNLLLGKLSIGEGSHFSDYYASRTISKIFLKKSKILKMKGAYFIILIETDLVKANLKMQSYLKSSRIWTNETTEINFLFVNRDMFSDVKKHIQKEIKSVHVLKYHESKENFHLEWLTSTEKAYKIKDFLDKENCVSGQIRDNLEDLFLNGVNTVLIVANPGMGKTYFVKNWLKTYSADSWVILLIFNEIDFKNVDNFCAYADSHRDKLTHRDKKIFDLYLKNKSVVVLFDGFDEVGPDNEKNALSLIKEASELEFKIVVTTREERREYLELNLNVLGYTLNPFTNDDKIKFLEHYYMKNINKSDKVDTKETGNKIKKFISILLKQCLLSNWDEEFTGIPLQCRLLAEGLKENCQRYCRTGDVNDIPNNLNLITLYKYFIDQKFNIYIEEKVKMEATEQMKKKIIKIFKDKFLENHSDAAVQIIYPKEGKTISEDFLNEIERAEEKHGIITNVNKNGKPEFIHRTFAEYFAAKWVVEIRNRKEVNTNVINNFLEKILKTRLSKNSKREIYLKYLLKQRYNVVRDLFDRMICKDCDLHIAIMNGDVKKLRDILEETGLQDDKKCGRAALHIICARGARHDKTTNRIERKEDEINLEIIDLLLEYGAEKDEIDEECYWTPIQYANHKKACGVIDRLLESNGSWLSTFKTSFMDKWKKQEILRMCMEYDYGNIAKNFLDLKSFTLEDSRYFLRACVKIDSARFAKALIQSQKLKSKHLRQILYGRSKKTLLRVAAEEGSVKIIDVLLEYIDKNSTDDSGRSALFYACIEQQLATVTALVERGALLFLQDNEGLTPMDLAIESASRELVEYVTSYDVLKIRFKKKINAPIQKEGWRALHYAARYNNVITLKRLIAEGANINITDKLWQGPLHLACGQKDLRILKILVDSGADPFLKDINGRTPIDVAIESKNRKVIEFLTSYEVLKIGFGKNINAVLPGKFDGCTALYYALKGKNATTLEELISKGANVNYADVKGDTLLHTFCKQGNLTAVKALVTKGAQLYLKNREGLTPMDCSICYSGIGNRQLAEYLTSYDLLKIGFEDDINATLPAKYDTTALHYAAMGKNFGTVERLISEGTKYNLTDKFGETALHTISKHEQWFDKIVASRLIKSAVHLDAQKSNGATALHVSAYWGNRKCLKLLLELGANVNITNNQKQTALHLAVACLEENTKCVELLLNFGANTNAEDIGQQTAMDWARNLRKDKEFLFLWENVQVRNERDIRHYISLKEDEDVGVDLRKGTFVGYSKQLSGLIDTMAEAGLFYEGIDSTVKCFKCLCLFTDWEPSDNPWIVHAKTKPKCIFIKQNKSRVVESMAVKNEFT